MTLIRRAIPAAALLLLAMTAAPVGANGPEVGWDGGDVIPLTSTTIRLVAEDVFIDLEGQGYPGGRARITYWLANPSAGSTTFEMTFLVTPDPFQDSIDATWRSYGFTVEAGGVTLPVRWSAASVDHWRPFAITPPDSLPVWTLTIPGGTTLPIAISYAVSWSGGGGEGADYERQFSYRARPARLWAGRLDFAQIRIRTNRLLELVGNPDAGVAECTPAVISPPGWFVDEGLITWRFEDWQPDADISITQECVEPAGFSSFLSGEGRQTFQVPNDYRFVEFGPPGRVYDGDSRRYSNEEILAEIHDAYARLRPRARRPASYLPFAVAFLTWRRNEIDARDGRPFVNNSLTHAFRQEPWYHAIA